MRPNRFLLAMMSLVLSCAAAKANTLFINNPSFETPNLGCAGAACFGPLVGWSTVGSAVIFAPSVGAGQEFTSLPDGSQVAALANSIGQGGEIFQDLSDVVTANTTYTLTFWVGQRSDVAFDSSYVVSLMANGIVLGSNSGASPAAGTFEQETITYVSGASPAQLGQTFRIDVSAPDGTKQADFDFFTLATAIPSAVPEPNMLGCVAMGLLGLYSIRRRLR